MFRPENPYKPDGDKDEIWTDIGEYKQKLFNEGVDATIKFMRKQASMTRKGEGCWVFIPDEVSQPDNGDTKESPCVRLHDKSA